MKVLLGVLVLMTSVSSFAMTYQYNCKSTQDYSDQMNISVNEKSLYVFSPDWASGKGKVIYTNEGLIGGNGAMKDRVKYGLDYDRSEIFPYEAMDNLYISKELAKGGLLLRNGSKGGFISYLGHGYSYESYICFAK